MAERIEYTFKDRASFPRATGIYCIENKRNGRKYVGQAEDVKDRWQQHIRTLRRVVHYNNYLQRAYIIEPTAFVFYVLEQCSIDELYARELFWIKSLNTLTTGNGYNIELPLVGGRKAVPEETRIRQSQAKLGVAFSEQHIANIKKAALLKPPQTKEHRANISAAKKGVPQSDAAKLAASRAKRNSTPYRLINAITGECFIGYNLAEWARNIGLPRTSIERVDRGLRQQYNGWHKLLV